MLEAGGGYKHVIRYWPSFGEEPREYAAQSGDFDIINDMHCLFFRDIDNCIETIEAALKERGISVQRPPLEAQNRQTDV